MTSRTRCGLVNFRECSELLYGMVFLVRLKGAAYKSYVRPALLSRSKSLCMKESKMKILQLTERSIVIAICEVQLKEWLES